MKRYFRRSTRGKSVKFQIKLEENIEEELIDPILLTPIEKDEPIFVYKRPNGTTVTFVIYSLIEFFVQSRRFVDPTSQVEFTYEDLMDIEDAAERAGLPRPNLLALKEDKTFKRQMKNKMDANQGCDRLMGEKVDELLDIIKGYESRSSVERTVHRLFDEISRYYQQLCHDPTNYEFAHQCRNHYIRHLKGPPHDPTREREGLLRKCLDFLDGLVVLTMIFD